ncbi:MAG: hypothetical protein ACRD3O_21785, partial [Terriglobia bacterium]
MKSKAVWITCALAALFCGPAANASVIMTLEQEGGNVVASGSGSLDLADLTYSGGSYDDPPFVAPADGALVEGNGGFYHVYHSTSISGPANFGSGSPIRASAGTGDPLGFDISAGEIVVPQNYVSGALSSTA